jgi:hypothetical protein
MVVILVLMNRHVEVLVVAPPNAADYALSFFAYDNFDVNTVRCCRFTVQSWFKRLRHIDVVVNCHQLSCGLICRHSRYRAVTVGLPLVHPHEVMERMPSM